MIRGSDVVDATELLIGISVPGSGVVVSIATVVGMISTDVVVDATKVLDDNTVLVTSPLADAEGVGLNGAVVAGRGGGDGLVVVATSLGVGFGVGLSVFGVGLGVFGVGLGVFGVGLGVFGVGLGVLGVGFGVGNGVGCNCAIVLFQIKQELSNEFKTVLLSVLATTAPSISQFDNLLSHCTKCSKQQWFPLVKDTMIHLQIHNI